ncbi:MAG: hypothetical protein M3137_12190 [Actinomycetota bacterium]|nr:hypothetical protein [Actinomycetota bacterium]
MLRRVLVAGAGGAVALMALAATAWACTSSPTMTLQPAANAAAAGSGSTPGAFAAAAPASTVTVKMTGGAWASDEAVQIHWNGLTGPLLATTQGGNFSMPIQVPKVAPGVYYVTASDPAGSTRVSQALEVTGPATSPVRAPVAPLTHPVAQQGGNNLMLGAGLLGGGLVAMLSVVALTTFGRRRASVSRRR